MTLHGPTVTLRPLTRADAPRLAAMLADDEVRASVRIERAPTLDEEEALIDALPAATDRLVLAVTARGDGRLLGLCGLHGLGTAARSAELGIFIGDRAERGKGFGAEAIRLLVAHAFDALGLARVTLRVFDRHARAIDLYSRVGFRRERLLAGALASGGRGADVVEMAIDRAGWQAAHGGVMR